MKKQIPDKNFAKRVVRLRLQLSIDRGEEIRKKDLATEMGVSVDSYSMAENGIIPGEKVLRRITDFHGVTPRYLLTGEGSTPIYKGMDQAEPPRMEAYDDEGLFGQTKTVDVGGQQYRVTTHEPRAAGDDYMYVGTLWEILQSDDPVLIQAIKANLRAFQSALKKDALISELHREINMLNKQCDNLKARNESLEKRLSDLERRMDQYNSGGSHPPGEPGDRKAM